MDWHRRQPDDWSCGHQLRKPAQCNHAKHDLSHDMTDSLVHITDLKPWNQPNKEFRNFGLSPQETFHTRTNATVFPLQHVDFMQDIVVMSLIIVWYPL